MRKKMVWRYWCDHCRKGGCSASAMKTHEKHCTLNPDRECRMCALRDHHRIRVPLADLRAIARNDPETLATLHNPREPIADATPENILAEVRDAAEGCPACILAALRQTAFAFVVCPFNYKTEAEQYLKDINDENYENEQQSIMRDAYGI